jgi:two-component system chemotaxis response regulator CheY
MKILVVDDSSLARRMVINQLRNLKMDNIHEANDGGEAIEFLSTNNDTVLVFLDWNMPGENGLLVLKRIKSEPKLKHIEVIMVTSEHNKSHILDSIACGACDFIAKPFTPDVFIDKIKPRLASLS